MTTLYDVITALVDREGGFVDHPADRGGPTRWGITQPIAQAFGYTGRMEDLSRNTAMQIYRERYWTQPRFDQIANRFQALAEELLDTGVNMGTAVAGRFLQRALNVLNREAKDFPDVTADGVIGKMTLYALDRYLATRGAEGRTVLLAMVNAQQSVRYIEIAEGNASQEAFSFGWQLNRVV